MLEVRVEEHDDDMMNTYANRSNSGKTSTRLHGGISLLKIHGIEKNLKALTADNASLHAKFGSSRGNLQG